MRQLGTGQAQVPKSSGGPLRQSLMYDATVTKFTFSVLELKGLVCCSLPENTGLCGRSTGYIGEWSRSHMHKKAQIYFLVILSDLTAVTAYNPYILYLIYIYINLI